MPEPPGKKRSKKLPPSYRRVEGSERILAPGAQLMGPANPKETLSVTIRVRRRPDAPPLPDQKYWSSTPPLKRTYLSREEFAAQYGSSQKDLDQVAKFARSHGLTVVETNVSKRTVVVSGTVAQMNKAFAVELGRYESATQKYRGREGHVNLPKDLVGIVDGVFGLDNRRVVGHHGGPPGSSPLTPPQVAQLYNFPTTPNATGQTIGILEFGGGYNIADLNTFFSGLGLNTPTIHDVPVDGGANSPGVNQQDDVEVALDIDVAGSVAQGANIIVYFAPNTEQSFADAILTAVFDTTNNPTVLSISWGGPELVDWTTSGINNMSVTLQDAAALGVTVFVSTGDVGSSGGPPTTAVVQYPASDPWVTACGGTIITNAAGASFNEGTWNDASGATGGGISDFFLTLPPWQIGVGVPHNVNNNLVGRGIPDVSGNASRFSGYNITAQGQSFLVGGTSAVCPLYAGLAALLNASLGVPVGYLNPTLYALGAGPALPAPPFRDINDGVSNAFGGAPGYNSGLNWDACTGWGSIDGKALLEALLQTEGARVIDPDDPFRFGIRPGETSWLNVHDVGGDDTGDDVELGNGNNADPNDATVITTPAPRNAAFAGQNVDTGDGAVGVFGRSKGTTRSIGVAGESETGCGVYGIGVYGTSIGVAGRSMGAAAIEDGPLEEVVGEPVGVLGHSTSGTGVRGHCGPLLALPPNTPPLPSLKAGPGGIFSSGQLQEVVVAEGPASQRLSLDALAQIRLVPSTNPKLPVSGRLGDLYVNVTGDVSDSGGTLTVSMYLCVLPGDGPPGSTAMWAPFHFDAAITGG